MSDSKDNSNSDEDEGKSLDETKKDLDKKYRDMVSEHRNSQFGDTCAPDKTYQNFWKGKV